MQQAHRYMSLYFDTFSGLPSSQLKQ
uniref:Uncharacterized protein n=1 Tax=Rhizophora mucronata TaxID=61149 RepID=A0A2P2IID4_RHIMU